MLKSRFLCYFNYFNLNAQITVFIPINLNTQFETIQQIESN